MHAGEPQEASVFTNAARNHELAHHPVCLYDEQALFNSVEYNYPLTMSPIMLVCGEGSQGLADWGWCSGLSDDRTCFRSPSYELE
jgi:hypothetical protein